MLIKMHPTTIIKKLINSTKRLVTNCLLIDISINYLIRFAGMQQIKIIKLIGKPVRVLVCCGKKSNEQAFLFWRSSSAASFADVHNDKSITWKGKARWFESNLLHKFTNSTSSGNVARWNPAKYCLMPNGTGSYTETNLFGVLQQAIRKYFHGSFNPFCQFIKTVKLRSNHQYQQASSTVSGSYSLVANGDKLAQRVIPSIRKHKLVSGDRNDLCCENQPNQGGIGAVDDYFFQPAYSSHG